MSKTLRIIDTGLRDGRMNIAFDQALIDQHQAGNIPDTIRFLRFPPTALVGRHQDLSRELKLDHCRANNIGVARRITGGGAIYFDEGQLGWELVLHRSTLGIASLGELASEICQAAASGLSKLGIAAKYRAPNEIEVDGHKISGTGGFFDGDTLFYQGTVLIDMNPAEMMAALNMAEAVVSEGSPAPEPPRITTLKALLGDGLPDLDAIKSAIASGISERFDLPTEPGEITDEEEAAAQRIFDTEIGTDAFVADIDNPQSEPDVLVGTAKSLGGNVSAYIRLEGTGKKRIREIVFTGNFFITPPRTVLDLEARLRRVDVDELADVIGEFFQQAEIGLATVGPKDFTEATEAALDFVR